MSTEQNVNNPAIRRTPRRHGRIRLLLVVGAVILSAFLFQRAPDLPEITRTALYSLFYSSIGNPTPLFKDVINFLSINSPLILALLVGGMVWVAFVIVSQNLGSWEKRRRVRIAIIFLLLLPFYGALLYISIFWIIPKFSPTTAAALLATLGKKGEIPNLLTDYNPVFTAIILMALWWPSTRFARFVHDRYFSQFNSYVLNEIGDLQSAFGRDTRPLKWQVPLRGIRAEAWGELQTFATGAADDQQKPFLWTAFVGRPGSGKTRSALQLAFQLAKRDETGRTQWIPHKHFLYWIWRVFFRKRRSLGGAWDIANIPSEKERDEPPASLLAKWRPRRPTLLLLDEPPPAKAFDVVSALQASQSRFRYRVRLLVINQTVPADLTLTISSYSKEHQTWEASQLPRCFYGKIVRFPTEAYFDLEEVELASAQLVREGGWSGSFTKEGNCILYNTIL